MVYLMFVGSAVESTLGKSKFLVLYLVAGLGASIGIGYLFPMIKMLGASGAVLGVVAIFPFTKKSIVETLPYYMLISFDLLVEGHPVHILGAVIALITFTVLNRKK